METTGRAAVAEFVATLAFVFMSAGSVVVAGPYGSGLLGVALATGFAYAVMVSATAGISGGFANPAVTIGLWVAGRLGSLRAVTYVAAQLAGGVAGAALLRFVVPRAAWRAANLGTPLLATGVSDGKGVLIEAILAFILLFAAFGTLLDDRIRPAGTAGLSAGLVLAFGVLALGPYTGAAVNPARSLGPELVSGTWDAWWVYCVGPVSGAVLGAVLYWSAFLRGREPAVP